MKNQVQQKDFNSYGARRGNHEVMMRGTFGNIKIRNEMAPGTEGGFTTLQPDGKVMSVYDAAVEYKKRGNDLIVMAGKEYGTGSSRDWAAAQSLEDPVPYSFPAITIKSFPLFLYSTAASYTLITFPSGCKVVNPPSVPGAISFLILIFPNVPLIITSWFPLLAP